MEVSYAIAKNKIEMWKIMENPELILHLEDLGLEYLPPLPENVKYLRCSNNKLKQLDNLPNGILRVWCEGNNLIDVSGLPETLQYINLSYNYELTTVDTLPDNIHTLIMRDCCNIEVIKKFPNNCRHILLNNVDRLCVIESIPPKLRILHIHESWIKTLPQLPSTLTVFECTFSKLDNLPQFPVGIKYIHCHCVSINTQSTKIPDGVLYLHIHTHQHVFNSIMVHQYYKKLKQLPVHYQKICNGFFLEKYYYNHTLYNEYKEFVAQLPKSIIEFKSEYYDFSFNKNPYWNYGNTKIR